MRKENIKENRKKTSEEKNNEKIKAKDKVTWMNLSQSDIKGPAMKTELTDDDVMMG